MRNDTSRKLFNYWNNLRGNRQAPDRREIEPSDIRDILGDTFILEIDPVYNTISFRLAGTRLCNAYGRELKGVGFLAIWDELDNLGIQRTVQKAFSSSTPCVVSYSSSTESGRIQECEMLLLPLLNGSQNASRILGTASPLVKASWLGTEPFVNNKLNRVRWISLPEPKDGPSIAPDHLAESLETQNPVRKFRHLTIIKGGMDD
ncbi:MAG: PAS domain-containing protein [Pseudomonadota bacterium]